MTLLYKTRNLLKLNDIYKLELAKFLFLVHHKTVSQSFYDCFIQLSDIYDYSTRQKESLVYVKPRIEKTIDKELLSHRGSNLWEEIDNLQKNLSWNLFKKQFKKRLLQNYSAT